MNTKGKELVKKIFVTLLEEEKKRGYSYSLGSRNPQNTSIVKLGKLTGRDVVFRVHYAPGISRDVNIIILRKRGKIVEKFLMFFNTRIGTIFLAIAIKIVRRLLENFLPMQERNFLNLISDT